MKKVLFIDDSEERFNTLVHLKVIPDHAVWSPNPHDAFDKLNDPWDVIFFDHDLNTFEFVPYKREITGKDVARFLTQTEWDKSNLMTFVHSMNRSGAEEIASILRDFKIKVMITPFQQFIPVPTGE